MKKYACYIPLEAVILTCHSSYAFRHLLLLIRGWVILLQLETFCMGYAEYILACQMGRTAWRNVLGS